MTALAPPRQDLLQGLRGRLDALIARGDLCGYLFHAGKGHDANGRRYDVSEISPSARGLWSDYLALRLNTHDPVARQVSRRVSPLAWVLSDLSEGGATDLADLVETHGFHCGVSAPIYGPGGLNGTMVVLSDRPNWREDQLESTLKDTALLAMRLADEVCSQTDVPADRGLSTREIECLRWAAIGKTDREIGMIIGLSHATVRYHIQRAGEKLNAVNRSQAVFKAGQLGYLGAAA